MALNERDASIQYEQTKSEKTAWAAQASPSITTTMTTTSMVVCNNSPMSVSLIANEESGTQEKKNEREN